jgi:hypothetical protein
MGSYDYVKKARKARKKLLCDYLGGKCVRCKYHECIEALDFHHIDPKEKGFTISQKWQSLDRCIEECKKCVLLCSNCHRELEYGYWDIKEINIPKPDEKIITSYKARFIIDKTCPNCLENFQTKKNNKKFCSVKCQQKGKRKVQNRPSSDELIDLVKNNGFVKTGALYGVSDNAVRKWLKSYGVQYKKVKSELVFTYIKG